jgi:site-specific recombinase XerD
LPTTSTGIRQRKKYYAVFKRNGKTKWIPLETTDRELAGRKAKEEIAKHKSTDSRTSAMTLGQLLFLYEQSIQGLAEHTQGTRKSILKIFKKTWKHGLEMRVGGVSKGQLHLWLSDQRRRLKNSSFNEYVRFLRHLFAIALEHKAIAESPAHEFKQVKADKPIRTTLTWEQFLAIVGDVRTQKFNADAKDAADLIEFMGRAGVGTAECANMRGEHVKFAADHRRTHHVSDGPAHLILLGNFWVLFGPFRSRFEKG